MTWLDRLLPASWRGVPFSIDSNESTGGTRWVRHEFVDRDLPTHRDLGAETDVYTFSAFLVGPDYDLRLQELLEALRQPEPGILVHPRIGSRECIALPYTEREQFRESGMARLELSFERTSDRVVPEVAEDAGNAVTSAREAAGLAALEQFVEDFNVVGLPQWVQDAAADSTRLVAATIRELDVFSGPEREVRALSQALLRLEQDTGALIAAPANLGEALQEAVFLVGRGASNPVGALSAYDSLGDLLQESNFGTDALADQAKRNAQAVDDIVHSGSAGGAVEAARAADYESYEDAVRGRDTANALLEQSLLVSGPEAYEPLSKLRTILLETVPDETQDLPRLVEITLQQATPALVVAYALYQDVRRADEITDRNKLLNPGMLPALTPLQVLSRD